MIGLPANGRMFLRGMRLLPPRAGMMATITRVRGSRQHRQKLLYDAVLLRFGQAGIERERERARVVSLCVRELARPKSQAAEIGLGVNRYVVHVHADPGRVQSRKCLGARATGRLLVPADDVEMPRRRTGRIAPGKTEPAIREQQAVTFGERGPSPNILGEPLDLAAAERGLDVGHAIIPAELEHLIIPGAVGLALHARRVVGGAVRADALHPCRELRIVGQRGPALPGGDDLDRMKAEDGDIRKAATADRLPEILAADGVRGILDDTEAVAVGKRTDAAHVARLAGEMHRHHDLRQAPVGLRLLELGLERVRAHVAAAQIDVDKVDLGAAVEPANGRGDEGVRGGPQPVSAPQSERKTGDVQRRGGAVDGNRVPAPATVRQCALEPGNRGPLGQPVRTQHRYDRVDVLRPDVLSAIRDVGRVQIRPSASGLSSIHVRSSAIDIHWLLVSDAYTKPSGTVRPALIRLLLPDAWMAGTIL